MLKSFFKLLADFLNVNKNTNNLNIEKSEEITDKLDKKKRLQEILNSSNIGDIIWAKRYGTEDGKDTIEYGHREGPFIVIGKSDKGLVCFKGSSVELISNFFCLSELNYENLTKTTYFKLGYYVIIDDFSFIRKIGNLNDNDLNMLYNKLKKIFRCYNYNDSYIEIKLPPKIGDIVSYDNKNYAILDLDLDNITLARVEEKTSILKQNLNVSSVKNIDFSNVLTIKSDSDIYYINVLDNNLLLYFLKLFSEYQKYIKIKNIPQRGSIIEIDKRIYYIYGTTGQDFDAFEILNRNIIGFDCLEINNNIFCTNYTDIKIDKASDFNVLYLATDDEVEMIKQRKKSFKKGYQDSFVSGEVIINKNDNTRNIILKRKSENIFTCVSVNSLIQAKYKANDLNISEIDKTSNDSLDGIFLVDIQDKKDISNIKNIEYIDKLLSFQKYYLQKGKDFIKKDNCIIDVNVGDIILYKSKLYYVSDISNNFALTYQVFFSQVEPCARVKASGMEFWTNYRNSMVFETTNKTEILYSSDQDELNENIFRMKKLISKNYSIENEFIFGDIIGLKTNIDGKYVVVDTNVDEVCAIKYSFGEDNPELYYFNKDDIIQLGYFDLECVKKLRIKIKKIKNNIKYKEKIK